MEWAEKAAAGAGKPINLRGLAIGNGLTEPYIQFKHYVPYAKEHALTAYGIDIPGEPDGPTTDRSS